MVCNKLYARAACGSAWASTPLLQNLFNLPHHRRYSNFHPLAGDLNPSWFYERLPSVDLILVLAEDHLFCDLGTAAASAMLTQVWPVPGLPAADRDAEIVAIAGVATPGVKEWTTAGTSWLEALGNTSGQALQVWSFDHGLVTPKSSLIDQLRIKGNELAITLKAFCDEDTRKRPVIFISHSLGGLILKETFRILRENLHHFLSVIQVIKGICFISTPHLMPSQARNTNVLEYMVSTGPSPLPKACFTVEDNATVLQICKRFQSIVYTVPIITVHESVETKLALRGLLARVKKPRIVVVPKTLSMIGAERESESIESNRSHGDTCRLQKTDPAFQAISKWLNAVLVDSITEIARLSLSENTPSLPDGTLRSHSVHPPMPVSERTPSEPGEGALQPSPMRATAGSTDRSYVKLPPVDNDEGLPARPNPRLPCFSVQPRDEKPFFGRRDILEAIDAKLLPSLADLEPDVSRASDRIRSFALCGMGGIGKSATALEYARTRRNEFAAIFWIAAEEKHGLPPQILRAAKDLAVVNEDDSDDMQEAVATFKNWLSRPVRSFSTGGTGTTPDEANWLLIFDNVDQLDILADFWPREGTGSILVTSRDPLALNQGLVKVDNGQDLTPLSEAESTELIEHFMSRSQQPEQGEAFKTVVDLLGGLPLLIEEMMGVIGRLHLSYNDFVTWWHEEGLEKISTRGRERDSRSPREGAYRSIFAALGYKNLEDHATALLQVMAYFDPDAIQEAILKPSAAIDTHNTNLPQDLAVYFNARKDLVSCSMIQHDASQRIIKLHRVTQDVAREKLGRDGEVDYLLAAVSMLTQVWPFQNLKDRFNTSRYVECATYHLHVIKLRAAYERLSEASPERLTPHIPAAALFSDFGWYWFERGYPQEAKVYFRSAQRICEASEDRETENVAYMLRETHNNQGSAAAETNEPEECLFHNKRWLDLTRERRNELGEPISDYELGSAYNEIGVAYAMNGNISEAMGAFEDSVRVYQELPDYEDTMLGWPLPNLGFMCWLQGNYELAEALLQEMRQVFEDAYGFDDCLTFKTGKVLYALGNVYTSLGRKQEGLDYHLRALNQYKSTLGNKHHRVADTYHRLADHYMQAGVYAEAKEYIQRAIDIFSNRSYYKHELARSIFKEAQINEASGSSASAKTLFKKAYAVRQDLYPGDKRRLADLTEKDYDEMIIFWSR